MHLEADQDWITKHEAVKDLEPDSSSSSKVLALARSYSGTEKCLACIICICHLAALQALVNVFLGFRIH